MLTFLTLFNTVVPAACAAVAIRIDSRLVGPYFAMSEVLPGFGGQEGRLRLSKPAYKRAFLRRFAWPGAAALVMAIIDHAHAHSRGAAIGAVTGALLLWPILFHGLPRNVSGRSVNVLLFFLAVLLGFITAGWFGAETVDWIAEGVDDGVWDFVRGLILPGVLTAVLASVALGYSGRTSTIR